jgi:hypothetical protein
MDTPETVNAEYHAIQMQCLLQRMQIDANMLQKMAATGKTDFAKLKEARESLEHDMQLLKAHTVFACNDLENSDNGRAN